MSPRLSFEAGILRVEGGIDFANANDCCEQGLALLARAEGPVTADLAGLEKAGSVSVAVLLRWAHAVAARGQVLQLAQVPDKCRAILRVSGLGDALPETGV